MRLVPLLSVCVVVPLAFAQPSDVTGSYASNWGDVQLEQRGQTVVGRYACCGGGVVDGQISGGTIYYRWRQSNGGGQGTWDINGTRLEGTWGHGQSTSGGGRWDLVLRSRPGPSPAELARQQAERQRQAEEAARQQAQRQADEAARQQAQRQADEAARQQAQRQADEAARQRQQADQQRLQLEQQRQQAEAARIADQARLEADRRRAAAAAVRQRAKQTTAPATPTPDTAIAPTPNPISAPTAPTATPAPDTTVAMVDPEPTGPPVVDPPLVPIVLDLPPELDLGTVRAGTEGDASCRDLSLAGSRGVAGQMFHLTATRGDGCESQLALAADGARFDLVRGVDAKLGDRAITVCLAHVPSCAAERPAQPVTLTIRPIRSDYTGAPAIVQVTWRVTGRSFFECHWWWLSIAGGLILIGFLAYGVLSPFNFSNDDMVRIATKQEALARAPGRRIRDLAGARSGFYRSAVVGIREDGSTTGKLRTAALILAARRGEIVILPRGELRRVNPQSRKLEPVSTDKRGHSVSRNVVYSSGGLFFTLT